MAYNESDIQAMNANVKPYKINWLVILPSTLIKGGIKAPKNMSVLGLDHINAKPCIK